MFEVEADRVSANPWGLQGLDTHVGSIDSSRMTYCPKEQMAMCRVTGVCLQLFDAYILNAVSTDAGCGDNTLPWLMSREIGILGERGVSASFAVSVRR